MNEEIAKTISQSSINAEINAELNETRLYSDEGPCRSSTSDHLTASNLLDDKIDKKSTSSGSDLRSPAVR